MTPKHALISLGTAIATSKIARRAYDLEPDDFLGALGLQRRRSTTLANLAIFGIGALVGAGTALLLAPAPGRETRALLGRELNKLGQAASEAAQGLVEEAEPLFSRVAAGQEERPRANSHEG